MIDTVFFDAAGTILHFAPAFADIFASRCNRAGLMLGPADVASAYHVVSLELGRLGEGIGAGHHFTSRERSRHFWTDLHRRILAKLGIQDELLVTDLFLAFSSPSSYALFTDVPRVLEDLGGMGYRLGVISNFDPWLPDVLTCLNVAHHFGTVVSSTTEGVAKPDPEIFRRAMQRAGTSPAHALHIGDSLEHDVIAATTAGMRAILLDRQARRRSAAHPTIASLAQLPVALRAWRP